MADLVNNANRYLNEDKMPRRSSRRYLEGAIGTFAYRTIEELTGLLDAIDQNQEAVDDALGMEQSQGLRKDVDMLIDRLKETTKKMSDRRKRHYN